MPAPDSVGGASRGSWCLPATVEAPAACRRAIREFIESTPVTPAVLGAIDICVSEAVTNVVVHAYRSSPEPGCVRVEADLDGGELSVRISDRGHGLELRIESSGLGLGVPLIAQLASSSEIVNRVDGGTEVVMRFQLIDAD